MSKHLITMNQDHYNRITRKLGEEPQVFDKPIWKCYDTKAPYGPGFKHELCVWERGYDGHATADDVNLKGDQKAIFTKLTPKAEILLKQITLLSNIDVLPWRRPFELNEAS